MKVIKKVTLPKQFPLSDVRKIFACLNDKKNTPPSVLMVGGCVRDLLLKEPIGDIDFATLHAPREVMRRFKVKKIKTLPTGLAHGTVTVVLGKNNYQITTLRRDVETDGRHARVSFSKNWQDDARRRDFTINTFLLDEKGHVYDPLGVGFADIKAQKIRFVGEASARIAEDYLRILRFYRFWARFGAGKIDAKTHAALKAGKAGLKTLSPERITEEVLKILATKKAVHTYQQMKKDGMTPSVFSRDLGIFDDLTFEKLSRYMPERNMMTLKRACLLNMTARYLRFSNAMIKEGIAVRKAAHLLKSFDMLELRKIYYLYDHDVALAAICLKGLKQKEALKNIVRAMKYIQQHPRPVFPWRGQDLIDLGYKPGPGIKEALQKLERRWIRRGLI